jgi:hypothetical protein
VSEHQNRTGRSDHPANQPEHTGNAPQPEPSQIHATHGFKAKEAQRRTGTAEARGGNDREQIGEKGNRGGV